MSCFLCNSSNHCDIHVSDESQSNITQHKNCCQFCLTLFIAKNVNDKFCKNCENLQKCYICFSNGHNTIYCSDRFKIPSVTKYLPNIDQDLISRYLDILNIEEQYFLAFTKPYAFNYLKLKPLQILQNYICNKSAKKFHLTEFRKDPNCILYVAEEVYYFQSFSFSPPNLNGIIFKPKIVTIKNSILSPEEFCLFLSSKTKNLFCENLTLNSKLEFRQILERIPNIEIIELMKTNVMFKYSWPTSLMNLRNKIKKIMISVNNINFDMKSMADFMKKNSENDVTIILIIKPPTNLFYSFHDQRRQKKLLEEFKKFFTKTSECINSKSTLTIVNSNKSVKYICL